MPVFTGTILNGEYDYYTTSGGGGSPSTTTGSSTIQAQRTNAVLPATLSLAYIEVITSGVPGENIVITGATFHWYDDSYVKSKTTTVHGAIQVWSGSLGQYQTIHQFTTFTNGVWSSHDFESHEWGDLTNGQTIILTGDGLTKFRMLVNDPGGSLNRTWNIGALEGSGRDGYLEIFYTSGAAVQRKARRFIMIG